MASSKVMVKASSPPNRDLPRHSPSNSFLHQQQILLQSSNDQSRNFGSMNMEEIMKTIYYGAESYASGAVADNGGGGSAVGGGKGKTVDEVWREIVSGGGGGDNREQEMTLEDFLTKAGAVDEAEENVMVPSASVGFKVETMMNSVLFQPGMHMHNGTQLGFGNALVAVGGGGSCGANAGGGGGGRGKRRAVEEVQLDKATQQKQRRMIKNRESAARSRERKQAYTVELEALVTQLEEENARLLEEEAELNKQRYKQLMENLIPVVEKRRPPRVLRRVQSISW